MTSKPDPQRIAQLKRRYVGQGLNEAELRRVEAGLGLHIPPTYRTFLSLTGKMSGTIPDWEGSDYAGDLLDLNLEARQLLTRNPHLQQLPQDAFVFLFHQGYSLLFVLASLGDASPVYTYAETEEPWMTAFEQVAEYLDDVMLQVAPSDWRAAKIITGTAITS
ncbi:SMI1/KNR4 family protein [Deinococcus aerius]|uniref:SMI1/KNR4 family protein n=1 Tax=Deinococcus aerius TaxID=200253 RepID=A0A2I9CTR9_9DEIO|nr:SMI1/KNR4 family protein [Deinococcus aerius]GBF05193.1 SMI1/KNR4 family protein [Deinococcus aerius]